MDKDVLDVDTLLTDFARLSIASNIDNPARRQIPKWHIPCAGLLTLLVAVAVCFCLQQPNQFLQVSPTLFLGSHIGAASNELAEVYSMPGDPLPAFFASLGSAESALHSAAVPHSLSAAVQPASTVVPAVDTGAAAGSAWAGMEAFPVAPAETDSTHNNLASETAEARTVQCSETTRLEPVHAAIAAVGTDAAPMQIAETAAAGIAIGTGANISMKPVSAPTPGPQPKNVPLVLDTHMSAVNVMQAVIAHTITEAHGRKIADDIAAAAVAFNPRSRWRVLGSTLPAADAAEADKHELDDLLMRLPVRLKQQTQLSSVSKLAAAVTATANSIEASASVVLSALKWLMCSTYCYIAR